MSDSIPKLSRCWFAQIVAVRNEGALLDVEDIETRRRCAVTGLFGYWGAEVGDVVKVTVEYVAHQKTQIRKQTMP